MTNRIVVWSFIVQCVFWGATARADEGGYIIIVNAKNSVESISKDDIKLYFLKEKVVWDASQVKTFPIDLPISNIIRRRFTKDIIGKRMEQVGAYWNKARAAGKKKPKVLKSDRSVVLKVGVFEGAIAYVKTGTPLTAQVKEIVLQP